MVGVNDIIPVSITFSVDPCLCIKFTTTVYGWFETALVCNWIPNLAETVNVTFSSIKSWFTVYLLADQPVASPPIKILSLKSNPLPFPESCFGIPGLDPEGVEVAL